MNVGIPRKETIYTWPLCIYTYHAAGVDALVDRSYYVMPSCCTIPSNTTSFVSGNYNIFLLNTLELVQW